MQGAAHHSVLFGLAMCLGHSVRLKAINGVTGAGHFGELRAKLSLLQSRHHPIVGLRYVCQWTSYKGLAFDSIFLFQSSFSLITIASSLLNSITAINASKQHTTNITQPKAFQTTLKMSSRSSYVSYGPRTSSSSVSSNGSASYKDYRVPDSSSRVYSVTRNNVQVTNHKQRINDPSEPRSSDASRYYNGSSYKR
ncbi:hypothetical protein V490_08784 [Pseudogymnoascus sp. VKM F-3557]|nr:hypothetical protein V490_08784 [Pseudogymnoascus sp. VKM F-3557]